MGATTPSQTVGPFFHFVLAPAGSGDLALVGNDLTGESLGGERIRVEGRVLDGEGAPVTDALVEIWQADGAGRYAGSADRGAPTADAFRGFGRCATDADGRFLFTTVKPGPVPAPDGGAQAPHILVSVFARGLLDRLVTRLYFAGDTRNDTDPVLALVPPERRTTLLAQPSGPGAWRFDIYLQGDDETVFFEV